MSNKPSTKGIARFRTGAAAVGLAVTAGVLPFGAGTANAADLPAELKGMHPVDNGVFMVPRIAPTEKGGEETWRVRAHFFVKNTAATPIKLTQISIGYPGNALKAFTKNVQDEDDTALDSRDVAPGATKVFVMEDGMAAENGTFGKRTLTFPLPREIRMLVGFQNYASKLEFRAPLGVWKSTAEPDGYQFPGFKSELAAGEMWSAEIHQMSRDQKFGYDFWVSRYDATSKSWTTRKPGTDGSKNEDFLIFGKPVRAMAGGTIVKCAWSKPDNPKPGVQLTGGSNHFVIDHGNGEFALYAHLKEGSVNPAYCPKDVPEDEYGLSIPIAAGAKLGDAGNSGASGGPHLHMSLSLGANGQPFGGNSSTGRPLYFKNVRNVGGYDNKSIGAGPFTYNVLAGQMPAHQFNLIRPGTTG